MIAQDELNTNQAATRLSDHIYNARKRSYRNIANFQNCTSTHFTAIADANLYTYRVISDNDPTRDVTQYLENWRRFEDLAKSASNNELNVRVNKSWRNKKNDGKKLWNMIDWKGRAETKIEKPAHEADTIKYFSSIFQSHKTKNNPVVSNISNELIDYNVHISSLDNPIRNEELDFALMKIGTGVRIDGILPIISNILPRSLKDMIFELMNKIFVGEYPAEWCKQILH